MIRNYAKKILWFKSLCLCIAAGNKIQHTYPCTLNFRDFSCVSWLLKMRHVHHIHGFVAIALAFGETGRLGGLEARRFFGGILEPRNDTKKFLWFKSLCLCVSAGNKIQHIYPCTLNFRDFSCVSWLLKMRHVHHIHGFVALALAFGETRYTELPLMLQPAARTRICTNMHG